MRLEYVNFVCPHCGNGNYMRHLIATRSQEKIANGTIKCINCNRYFNLNELTEMEKDKMVKNFPPYLDYPKERKPQTNFDSFKTMTIEEMARAIAHVTNCPRCPARRDNCGMDCIKAWVDWLKQEAD